MKKSLAASFLVTVGVAGCAPEPAVKMSNPPPVDLVHPVEPEQPEQPEPEDTGDSELPKPGPSDKVVTKKDGTCWVMPEVDCPPSPATCNPPPPMQVACPEEQ